MIKKIVSFGDSFIFGTELKNNTNGSQAWPGLIAAQLGCEYETRAIASCGNDHIARQVYSYFSTNDKNVLAVINWTWIERFDFYVGPPHERWTTLGTACVPQTLAWLNNNDQAVDILDFYRDFGRSVVWNKFRNLQTINSVQSYLKLQGIPSIQTYMDYALFDQTHEPLNPDYVKELQSIVKPNLSLFDNDLNFLDWARNQGFDITDPWLHPLEPSHEVAANLWLERYREKLNE